MENKLLYGKASGIKSYGITSIEIKDDIAELFIQDEEGNIRKELTENRFWILSHESRPNWHKLKGRNYYGYGKQFDNRETFLRARQALKKTNDIYTVYNEKESFQLLKGYTYYRGLKPKDVSILSFDLETTGLLFNKDSKILLISNTFRRHNGEYDSSNGDYKDEYIIEKKLFAYDDFHNEEEMLVAWCDWVKKMDPSIITGHNINSFDFHYLQFIARRAGVKLRLGRDNSELKIENYESKFRKDGSQDLHYKKSHIYGREIVDTLFLAIRYDVVAKKHPTYGLKAVIKAEGLEKANRAFYDASQIRHNYKNPIEWGKIKAYCKDDSDDALALFDLMAAPQFFLAQMVPKPFQLITESATGSQINSMMVRSYLQDGHSIPKTTEVQPFEGAISEGVPGIHKNVLSFDVASLYPSIMLEYKVNDLFKDPENHFITMLETLTNERFKNKKLGKTDKYYKDLEQSQKVLINSFYGFKAAPGLNFNDPSGANFITQKGREILKSAIKWATGQEFEEWKNAHFSDNSL